MGSCEPVCRNSLIVVPAFFLIFGGLILMFVGAAFSPKSRADGFTFSREARLSISLPCIVSGAVLTSLGIIHCVTMAVCLPLAKQYMQRSMINKLAREWGEARPPDDTISVLSDDILAAEGEGVAIGPKRRREAKPQADDETQPSRDAEGVAAVKSQTFGSYETGLGQPAKETALNPMLRLLNPNVITSSRKTNSMQSSADSSALQML